MSEEKRRLADKTLGPGSWRHWGPYVSERQWGTVREDYSAGGDAWAYFPHEHARSRAYRWGEDGIAGVCDAQQTLCLTLALWNERDEILKERFFGLTNGQGNHGEDVKEQYFYLDGVPTNAYLKMLYKYPHAAFPYTKLVEENARRSREVPEYELLDTGVLDEQRYFDVFIEYAQVTPGDLLMRVTAHNRGPVAAPLHLVPLLTFRNTWSWKLGSYKPALTLSDRNCIAVDHHALDAYRLYVDGGPEILFTENDTNAAHVWQAKPNGRAKDGFNERIVQGNNGATHDQAGTRAAAWYRGEVAPGASMQIRLRLAPRDWPEPFDGFNAQFTARIREADEFYGEVHRGIDSEDARNVQRQAFAGLVWSKQFYYFDIPQWLAGDPSQPTPPESRRHGRDSDWRHLNNADIVAMPDKWEYPWYAAWDLAFHCLTWAYIDADTAKHQLILLTREWYMHPNGQMPAYEWAFGDVNPPVHAWAAWRVYQIDRKQSGRGDIEFLERVFHKLMINFTWWVNRKDAEGRNVFQGGFLGLDNIGVFDRSSQLPTGGHIDQSDGTSWMAMYSLNLMRIALELAQHNHVYEDIASKFFEHFLHIAEAMSTMFNEGGGLWDDEEKFFYDVLHLPNGERFNLKVRSLVGLVPLFAVETIEPELLAELPGFRKRLEWFLNYRPDLAKLVSHWQESGRGERRLLSLLRGHRMKKLLQRMLDESEFLSDYGVRALSRAHLSAPYEFKYKDIDLTVRYSPAESESALFGGNSNWRGPIWFPMNFLLIESLQKFHHYYGDDFKLECPTGSGHLLTLAQIAEHVSQRLAKIFLRDADGKRAVRGHEPQWQLDPYFRDSSPFYEYFHGDRGRGAGAAHQTGWTALIAKLLMPRGPE